MWLAVRVSDSDGGLYSANRPQCNRNSNSNGIAAVSAGLIFEYFESRGTGWLLAVMPGEKLAGGDD